MAHDFGALEKVPLRDVWPKEATSFTPWLADHLDSLGQALGVDLELVEREAAAGDFSLDLLARDLGTGRTVVIENQITATDHDHLGKLLTYASAFDASIVVWIAEALRDEHRQAIEWLNQRTDLDTAFFAVVIEVVRIDQSRPAYHFNPIVFPNEWRKQRRGPARPTSSRGEKYRSFFQELIDELREQHKFTNARAGQPQNWYTFSSGISGVGYGISFAQGDRVRVEIYIDQGDAERNKEIFDTLELDRDLLQNGVEGQLEWERLDDKRASRIAVYHPGNIEAGPEALVKFRQWAIARVLEIQSVFGDRVKSVINDNAQGDH